MPRTVHKLNRSRTVHRVVVVGCGGTGSAVIGGLPFLHQALLAAGRQGLHVIVADGGRVTATNCVRQPFSEWEVGLYKSVVLESPQPILGTEIAGINRICNQEDRRQSAIVISCVDTRAARLKITMSRFL